MAELVERLQRLPQDAEVEATISLVLDDLSKPMTDAERAREYRRRKSKVVTPTVTKNVTLRDGGERGGSAYGSEKQAEKKGENGSTCQVDLGATVTKTVTKRDARRWRTVPQEWQPNDAHRALAKARNVDFELELSKFRDHDFAAPKLNADATFRNWLRNAPSRNGVTRGFKSAGTLLMERSARIAAEEGEKIPVFPLLGGSR